MSGGSRLSNDEWRTVVENVPIVSVDLVVRHADGILLGERTNEPAKGEWFVPGGRVRKGERLEEAVDRIAREEIGVDVEIERRLGVYEHHYDVAELDGVDGKHYVPIAYLVSTGGGSPESDEQHAELRSVSAIGELDLHPYVEAYLRDAGVLD